MLQFDFIASLAHRLIGLCNTRINAILVSKHLLASCHVLLGIVFLNSGCGSARLRLDIIILVGIHEVITSMDI